VIVVGGYSFQTNPFFIHWKQKDQLILSALLSFFSMDVLHLVVNCKISHCIFRTLEQALASPCNFYIMQLHGSSQDFHQGDDSVLIYIYIDTHTHTHTEKAKILFDKLGVVGQPSSLEDFNLFMFWGLRGEFKDLVTSLTTKA
jgi:hypothetical protein